MIEYRMMDETCLLCRCLHGGPVPVDEALATTGTAAESETSVKPGAIARFLRAVCQAYGSCAVLAIDGSDVIGKIRFYPTELADTLGVRGCAHEEASVRGVAAFDVGSLPSRKALSEDALGIQCGQIAEVHDAVAGDRPCKYLGQGIGTNMLKTLIDWARAEGWDQIRASNPTHSAARQHWYGLFSVDRYKKMGFEVTGESTNEDLKGGVVSQRQGNHGELVKKMWEQYAHLSDEEAATVYNVVLDLNKTD